MASEPSFCARGITGVPFRFPGKSGWAGLLFRHDGPHGIVDSGESAPFGMNKPISDHAFDVRYFECGFWPGSVTLSSSCFLQVALSFYK